MDWKGAGNCLHLTCSRSCALQCLVQRCVSCWHHVHCGGSLWSRAVVSSRVAVSMPGQCDSAAYCTKRSRAVTLSNQRCMQAPGALGGPLAPQTH